MKNLQKNTLFKFCSALVLLVSLFTSALMGGRMLTSMPLYSAENEQATGTFSLLLRTREDSIATAAAHLLTLETNGSLTYAERQFLQNELDEMAARLSPEQTRFRFQVKTEDGSLTLYSNLKEEESLEDAVEEVYYATFIPGEHIVTTLSDPNGSSWADTAIAGRTPAPSQSAPGDGTPSIRINPSLPQDEKEKKLLSLLTHSDLLVIECGVPAADLLLTNDGPADEFAELARAYQRTRDTFSQWSFLAAAGGTAALLALLLLLWSAGHRPDADGIVPGHQDRVFLEIYTVLCLGVGFLLIAALLIIGDEFFRYVSYRTLVSDELLSLALPGCALLATLLAGVVVLFLRTVTVRLKAGTLAESSLICRLLSWFIRFGREVFFAIPFLWKTIFGFVLYFLVNSTLLSNARYESFWGILWLILNVAVLLLLCWWGLGFRRLRQGCHSIAMGNVDHRVDTRRIPQVLKDTAEDLNNISAGLAAAVGKQMRSERFKAELITNVSHDLKTPLTSIINYVDLLKTTQQPDPKAQEYIQVLDKKSQRLKKLTEDLVEASKASTGTLNVNREKISLTQLLDQALGEWQEKLESRSLSVVTSLPDTEAWVYADGRHLWRVVDNLLSNCSKYALDGTRIYLDLARGHGQVSLSVKNISRDPLNVPAERLMERFVRGEESRSTEGSGLGLSIARSLTELQGGTFSLAVDGDLFKAVVTLPQAN